MYTYTCLGCNTTFNNAKRFDKKVCSPTCQKRVSRKMRNTRSAASPTPAIGLLPTPEVRAAVERVSQGTLSVEEFMRGILDEFTNLPDVAATPAEPSADNRPSRTLNYNDKQEIDWILEDVPQWFDRFGDTPTSMFAITSDGLDDDYMSQEQVELLAEKLQDQGLVAMISGAPDYLFVWNKKI